MSQTPGWTTPGDPGAERPTTPPAPTPPGAPPPAPGATPGWGTAPGPMAYYGQPGIPGAPWGGPPPAPRPGVVPLRPLGVGEILDASITYVRRNPRATLGLSTIVAVASGLIQLLVLLLVFSQVRSFTDTAIDSSDTGSDSVDITVNAAQVGQGLLTFLLQLVATGLLTFVMSQAVLGRGVTIREAWDRVRPLFWRLIGVTLLTGLLILLAAVLPLLPAIVLLAVGATALGVLFMVLGALAAIALCVWVYVGLVLAPPALILERTTVRGALTRSRQLVKGSFWRVLGISLLATVLVSIIAGIISIPFALIGGIGALVFDASDDTSTALTLLGITIGSTVSSIVTLPFAAGVTALLYIDRRMRREGLDLELVRAAGLGTTDDAAPSAGPTQPPGTGTAQQW